MAQETENTKKLRRDFFTSYWNELSTQERKHIAASSYSWNDLGRVRFVYEKELNILLFLDCDVDILSFVQHDGSFAVYVKSWNYMKHYDILEIIRSVYEN